MELTALELASGVVSGRAAHPPLPRPAGEPRAAARAAFERAVRAALLRPPCLVSFSGGLDSSTVLATAVRLARQERLALPVPITWRFASVAEAEESDWQERVMAELGLDDWVVLNGDDEPLGFAGAVARGVLARHGVLFPANAHLHVPLLEHARSGSLITGVGGDEVLGTWPWAERGRGLDALARASAPGVVWRAERLLRAPEALPWLTRRALPRARWAAAEAQAQPAAWSRRTAYQASRRRVRLSLETLRRLATAADVRVVSPFLDPAFFGAVAAAGGRRGLGRRPVAMRALLGDLVPKALASRASKATFGDVFWDQETRERARRWDGEGPADVLRHVDAAALRRAWRADEPPGLTASLLQAVTLRGEVSC